MTTKTTKTLVFAALIAAMILPFSGMQSVFAEEDDHVGTHMESITYQESQQKLVDILVNVEQKIETVQNDTVKERFLDLKQNLLKKLLDRSEDFLGPAEIFSTMSLERPDIPIDVTTQDFYLDGSFIGCGGIIQDWTYSGTVPSDESWIGIEQNFISPITDEQCGESHNLTSVSLKLQPVFTNSGCYGSISVPPVYDYWLDCGKTIHSDLWIVEIIINYGSIIETHYTSIDV